MSLDGLNVLVVEDDVVIQMDIQMLLEDHGAEVTCASNLADGLVEARKSYSAAILDIMLPDGEVFPLAEILIGRHVPVVFHSGNIETSRANQRFPKSVILSKPSEDKTLIDAVLTASSVRHDS